MDTDNDGLLSKAEFEYVYVIYCPDATKTIDELYQAYGLTYEDKMTVEEFIKLYCLECGGVEVQECT